ncbi:MAG TPA: hypothetical protein VF179_28070, partial [Thermoanaerobaculia bacterium]|nr:hypothetical protein [Thermoanaerobaculia bacterium]
YLSVCEDPFSLEDLAKRIRSSSNFRFEWQFYHFNGIDPRSPLGIRKALDSIIGGSDLHRFLQTSFDAMYDDSFEIEALHQHCRMVSGTDEFENVLASAAGDRLGAYSRDLRDSNAREKEAIRQLFGGAGSYFAYQLLPGEASDCAECRHHNNHLFTTWFYGVAWDWCLFASWPDRKLLWMGCLTDTD